MAPETLASRNGLGQALPLPDLRSLVPAGVVNVVLRTPLGVAIVDPFAAAQDPNTQAIMNALGITVEIVFGQPSPSDLAAPRLSESLKAIGLLAGGVLLLRMIRR